MRSQRLPLLRCVVIGVMAMSAAACNRAEGGASNQAGATQAASSRLAATQPADAMTALKNAIDEVAAADRLSVGYVETLLSVRLKKESDNGSFTFLVGNGGRFAGLAVKAVDLRISNKEPANSMLAIELAQPGPDAMAFARRFWGQPDYMPPSPHSRASSGYWSTRQGGNKISIGHPFDQDHISSVVIDRISDTPCPPEVCEPAPLPPIP
jgi:hypothetical protein